MPVLDFKMVYRDGAAVSAPVTSFKLVDNNSELTGIGIEGDLAYAKNTDLLYVHNGTTWMSVGAVFNGGTITNDLTIKKNVAKLVLDNGVQVSKARFEVAMGPYANLSFNIALAPDGASWIKDDNTKDATTFQPKENRWDFFHNVGGNWIQRAVIDQNGVHSGGFFSYNRANPDGDWLHQPITAGDLYADQPNSVTIQTVDVSKYTYIGRTLVYAFNVYLTLSQATSAMYMKIPAGLTAPFPNFGWGHSTYMGPMYFEVRHGQNFFYIKKSDNQTIPAFSLSWLRGDMIIQIG